MDKKQVCEAYGDDVSDVVVWVKLAEGNKRALKTLFLRHYNHLFNYALKICGCRLMAEDCTHDLFFHIWKRRKKLGKVKSVKSYLWISLRRDLMRKIKSTKNEILTDEIAEYSTDIQFNPEEFVIHNERRREYGLLLAKAMNQLPSRQREAVYLKYYNGMGYDEIEQIMSISYQTARNYVYDGVQAMKARFDEESDTIIPIALSIIIFLLLA